MEKLIIKGGKSLYGEVYVSGAKNASLPVLAAVLLAGGRYRIKNVPCLRDVCTMNELLGTLGVECRYENGGVSVLNSGNCGGCIASYELVKTMRASILVLGPMLSKTGRARVALPGGCAIGERPVNYHISALEKMGAEIEVSGGYINASCARLHGAEIIFDKVTVTGTENILMAASLADGETVIQNAAREPEVVDLAGFLKAMGADISGAGTSTITVRGVKNLHPADYSVMSDRIEAGTFLCAVAACGGRVIIHNCPVYAMGAVIEKLREAGLNIKITDDFTIEASSDGYVKAVNVETFPYPGFPTDMQSQFMAVMLKADGVSLITESIFENRFMHVPEFKRMGADVSLNDSIAVVRGCRSFSGAPVMASDLRASAGLVIAALMADNTSEVRRIYHLDRGYESFEKKLSALGADIRRVKSDE